MDPSVKLPQRTSKLARIISPLAPRSASRKGIFDGSADPIQVHRSGVSSDLYVRMYSCHPTRLCRTWEYYWEDGFPAHTWLEGSGGVTRSMVLACRSVPMAEHRRPVGTGVEVEFVCLGEGMLVMMQAGEKSFWGGNVTLSRHQGGGGETSWVRAVMRSRRRGCRIFGCAGVETLELFGGHAGHSVGLFSSLPVSPTIPVPRGSFALRVVGGDGHCLA